MVSRDKIIMGVILAVVVIASLFLIKIPIEEELSYLKYFDKAGKEIRVSLSIAPEKVEYLKLYLNIENEFNFPITCKLKSISPSVNFPKITREIPIGGSGVFESELIDADTISTQTKFNTIAECSYISNGLIKNLPDKVGTART